MHVYEGPCTHRERKMGGVDRSVLCTAASHSQSDPSSVSGCILPPSPSPFHWFRSLSIAFHLGLQFILISPSWAPLCIFLLESTKLRWSWSPHSVLFLETCSNGGCQIPCLAFDFPTPEYTDLKLLLPLAPPASSVIQNNAIQKATILLFALGLGFLGRWLFAESHMICKLASAQWQICLLTFYVLGYRRELSHAIR